jgi:ABC-2 type transport system permease protein
VNKFLWLIRRELWESRTVWIAPAICAAIVIGGVVIASALYGAAALDPQDAPALGKLTPAKVEGLASVVLASIAMPFFIMVLFTQFFYALDALYGDRRDRSILFWKSLPVSDTESVLAKLAVAAVIFPAVALAAAFATQVIVFLIGSIKLSAVSQLAGHFWDPGTWAGSLLVMGYVYAVSLVWYLPLLGWALVASAWAPRSPFMWAAMPPLALGLLELIVFRSSHVLHAVGERVGNATLLGRAFGAHHATGFTFAVKIERDSLAIPHALTDMMRPAEFFSSPAVWLGLVVAAGFVAAAIWVRRYRDASA